MGLWNVRGPDPFFRFFFLQIFLVAIIEVHMPQGNIGPFPPRLHGNRGITNIELHNLMVLGWH